MNRRDALAALMSLPAVTRIEAASLRPKDVIVVESNSLLSETTRTNIITTLERVFPDRKIVVFDAGLRLKLVQG